MLSYFIKFAFWVVPSVGNQHMVGRPIDTMHSVNLRRSVSNYRKVIYARRAKSAALSRLNVECSDISRDFFFNNNRGRERKRNERKFIAVIEHSYGTLFPSMLLCCWLIASLCSRLCNATVVFIFHVKDQTRLIADSADWLFLFASSCACALWLWYYNDEAQGWSSHISSSTQHRAARP